MTLESRVYEKEIKDHMTDETPTIFTIEPGKMFPVNEKEALANYTEEPIDISIQLHQGRTLIGFHSE